MLQWSCQATPRYLDTLIQRKVKPRLREMMAPFHNLREADSHAWTKKLISYGNAMEQNACLNRAYTNTVADTNVTSNTKKQPNASTSNPSTNTTPKKFFNKDKPPSTEHVLPTMKEK